MSSSVHSVSRGTVYRVRRHIPWRRVLIAALVLVGALRVVEVIATECSDVNASNCTSRGAGGPDWTDITVGGYYVRLYWPHFAEAR